MLTALLLLPAAVQGQLFSYITNNDSTITVTKYTGSGTTPVVPSKINNLWVTVIGNGAFQYNSYLTSVTLPATIVDIESSAFDGDISLTSITIPNAVTNIGDYALHNCGFTNLTLGTNLINIGSYGFAYCAALPNLKLPDTVTSIGTYAFLGCISLTNFRIPGGVSAISQGMFGTCSGLAKIFIPQGVTTIGATSFYDCTSLTNVTIPSSVTDISDLAFYGCSNLSSIFFGGNAPNLGYSVFKSAGNAIAYYLDGAVGWSPTFGGLAAVLWNPQMSTSDGAFGVGVNGFAFNITGTANIPIVLEAATSLPSTGWTVLQTCALTNGAIYFSDPQRTNYPTHFYRIRSP